MSFSFFVALQWVVYALVGTYVYGFSARGDYSFYDLGIGSNYGESFVAHILASLGLLVGSSLAVKTFRLEKISYKVIDVLFAGFRWGAAVSAFSILVLLIVLFLSFYTYGVEGIFYRTYYLPEPDAASVAAQILGFLVLFLACFLLCSKDKIFHIVAVFCVIVIFFVFFAKGSRVSAFVLLTFGIWWIWVSFAKLNVFVKCIFSIFVLISSLCLTGMLLYFRAQVEYGLFPFLVNSSDAFNYLWIDDFQGGIDILLNISFSIPVTQLTILSAGNSTSDLIVALTPFGGVGSGWVQLANSRRISIDIPFSAFGELYAYSQFFLFLYMMFVGVFFAFIEDQVGRGVGALVAVFGVVFFVFVVMFSLLAPQYNLRSTTRVIWYAIGLFFVVYVIKYYFPRRYNE